ncbi:MAG: hypothetical protein KKA81_08565 [Bacteroidetes bacterium]|nr:hypothetical protein [Bacteroidota bacterium]
MKQAIIIFLSSRRVAIMQAPLSPDGQVDDLNKISSIRIKAKLYAIIKYILTFFYRLVQILFFGGLILGFFYLLDTYQNKTERRYGFTITTPYLSRNPPIEPIMINNLNEGGVFEKAGFKGGDIVLFPQFESTIKFYNYLKQPGGTELWLEVIRIRDYDTDLYLEGKCKKQKIKFVAP